MRYSVLVGTSRCVQTVSGAKLRDLSKEGASQSGGSSSGRSGGSKRRGCPNCGHFLASGHRKCYYCKWQPWYVERWYVPVIVLGCIGLVLTVQLFLRK